MIIISSLAFIVIVIIVCYRSKKAVHKADDFQFVESEFRYTVYQSFKNQKPRSLTLIFAGNRIDDLGYKVYSSYRDKLDEIDIYIRDAENDELMKIVTESDSESMIGVNHPEEGHIGYLQYEIVS